MFKSKLCPMVFLGLALQLAGASDSLASSHREAPNIARFPTADNTDVYFFRSPENPSRVVMIGCFIPLQQPYAGPNFHFFDPDLSYNFHIDNDGDAVSDIDVSFTFTGTVQNPNTFLYNNGVVTSLTDANLNFRQTYSISVNGQPPFISGLPVAPAYVGTTSMPDYVNDLVIPAIQDISGVARIFVGPRDDGFFVNLAQVFDLLSIGPGAFDGVAGTNVHVIAIEVETSLLTGGGDGSGILGLWSTTSVAGFQLSRLSAPLVNEVVIPRGQKDNFNSSSPSGDGQFLNFVTNPELAVLLNALFGCPLPATPRNDLVEVFLTGVSMLNQPPSVTPGEMMRLNTNIAPLAPGDTGYSALGVLGGDDSGYPNGRRVADDVTDISLRAVAGALVSGTPPNCLSLSDGVSANDVPYLATFPFLGHPHPGNQ